MGNANLSKLKVSEKERSNRCGTAGMSTLDSNSEQRLTCFKDILDLVLHMSDEEWKAVSRDMAKEVTRPEFAAASTRILMVVLSAVFRYLLKPLSESLGVEAILEANDKLKSKSTKCSASDAAALRSPTEASDFICHFTQRIVKDIKAAMLEAIQSTATGPRVSYPARASPGKDPLSHLDEYSIACTNEICDNVLALYLAEEFENPEGKKNIGTSEKSHQEVHGIMKGLEEAVSNNRSSGFNIKSLISELVSKMTKVKAPNCASLVPLAERPFSDHFMSKASQMVNNIILKTEQKIATSVSPQTHVPLCSETELNFLMELVRHSVSLENIQESAAAKLFPNKNTRFASDILMKKLSSYISTGLIKVKDSGSCTASPSMGSVDLDQVACDIVNRVISETALEIEVSDQENPFEAWAGDTQGNEPPHLGSFPNIPRNFGNFSGDQRFIDAERMPQPSAQNVVPSNLFTAVRNHLKTFFIFLSKSAADDKRTDAPSTAEDHIVPIYIGEDGSVQELSPEEMIRQRAHAITDAVANLILRNVPKTEDIGRSTSDTVLERGNSTLQSIHFPTKLVYRFVEESTKALVQDVLNAGMSAEAQNSSFVDTLVSCPTAVELAHKLQDSVCPSMRLHSAFPRILAGSSRFSSQNQGNKTKLGFRFIVKMNKVVIRWPIKHFQKQLRSPLPRRNYSTTVMKRHSSPHKKSPASRMGFKRARRMLDRICEFTRVW